MLLVSSYEPSTWLCNRAMQFQSIPTIWPLLTTKSPVAQWLEHPTRSRRVGVSNPFWGSDSESTFLLEYHVVVIFFFRCLICKFVTILPPSMWLLISIAAFLWCVLLLLCPVGQRDLWVKQQTRFEFRRSKTPKSCNLYFIYTEK